MESEFPAGATPRVGYPAGRIPYRITAEIAVFDRQRCRHAVAELRRVGGEVRAESSAVRAGSPVGSGPHGPLVKENVEERLAPAERPATELDEGTLEVVVAVAISLGGTSRQLETATVVAPQRAVFGLGTDVERNDGSRPRRKVGRLAACVDRVAQRIIARRLVEVGVETHPATDLQACIGTGDVEEPFPVETAYPHVLDRLGLDGKIGSLCPNNRNESRCGAEEKAFHHLHRDLQSLCVVGGFRLRRVSPPWKVP